MFSKAGSLAPSPLGQPMLLSLCPLMWNRDGPPQSLLGGQTRNARREPSARPARHALDSGSIAAGETHPSPSLQFHLPWTQARDTDNSAAPALRPLRPRECRASPAQTSLRWVRCLWSLPPPRPPRPSRPAQRLPLP